MSSGTPSAADAIEPAKDEAPPPPTHWTEEQIVSAVSPVRAGARLTPKAWPKDCRVAVCISFDVDDETLCLSRGETEPGALSAGEFGATAGLRRVLELLARHAIPASFFVPAASVVIHPRLIDDIAHVNHHEIGLHGWIHENLAKLNDRAEEERLLNQSIDKLTKAARKRPVGFRAPYWAFSTHTLDLLCKASFLYDSSLMARDEPYELVAEGKPTGLVELPVDWALDDVPYFGRTGALLSPELGFKNFRDDFDIAYAEGTLVMMTFHPHIIGRRSRIGHLDTLIEYMKSKSGVWFATAEQIARHVECAARS